MPAFLTKYAIIGLGALALIGALWVQTARLGAAQKETEAAELVAAQWRANFDASEIANKANLEAIARLQAETARINEIAAQEAKKAESLAAKLKGIERNAATKDDGPLAPVLEYVLNSLRDPGTSPGGGD